MESVESLEEKKTKRSISFDNLSFALIFVLVAAVPVFFLPLFNISIEVSKSVLVSTLAAFGFFFWLIARMKDGRFIFPKSSILGGGVLILLTWLFSSAFSNVPATSFVGIGYEVGTFSSLLVLGLLMFLSSIFFQQKERISHLYSALFLGAAAVFIYQVARFVFLSFSLPLSGVFAVLPQNLIGKWADLAIFFGLIAILSLITLELMALSRKARFLLRSLLALSLFILVLINLKLAWVILGFFTLVIFVYVISFGSAAGKKDERTIPAIPFAVLLISMFFVLAGGAISNTLYSFSNIPQEILRPSWTETFNVARSAFKEDPFLGSGPNTFMNQWLLFKPDGVNSSNIWNVDFAMGVGLIPSLMVSTGILGALAWLLFLGAFLYRGVVSVFLSRVDVSQRFFLLSSFLSALYLWLFATFYVPDITIIFLAFVMTGVFISSAAHARVIKNYNFSFLEDPRVGFVSVLVLILLILGTVAGGYIFFQRFLSVGYFQQSITAFRVEGDLDKAEQNITRAVRLNKSDLYYRTFAEMNLARIEKTLSQSGISKETIRAEFQSVSQAAILNAVTATEIDKANYLNWMTRANIYGTLMSLAEPKGFYQAAQESYGKALALNPHSPAIRLAQARLELLAGNKDAAKGYIAQALNEKNNYTEAIFLLSQIQADEGNLSDAIASAEVASFVSPNDMGVFFQLGLLRYKNGDYGRAISAFERAVELNSSYSNARYFLGLSYSKEGERAKAIEQFEAIRAYNPDNEEVRNILRDLKAGESPLSGAHGPEDRKTPPLKEN